MSQIWYALCANLHETPLKNVVLFKEIGLLQAKLLYCISQPVDCLGLVFWIFLLKGHGDDLHTSDKVCKQSDPYP